MIYYIFNDGLAEFQISFKGKVSFRYSNINTTDVGVTNSLEVFN